MTTTPPRTPRARWNRGSARSTTCIRNHEIVERDENSNTVEHATIVQIVYEGDADDDRQEFFIGSIEEKPDGVLVASPTSPLGSALLGHKVGDEVEYEAPSGVLRLKIVGIALSVGGPDPLREDLG